MANLRRDDEGEMSIEEILASIRRYVGDDSQPQPQEEASFSASKFEPTPAPVRVEPDQTAQALANSLSMENSDLRGAPLPPSITPTFEPSANPVRMHPAPENVIRLTEAHVVKTDTLESISKLEAQDGLLSPHAQAATIQSFAKLAEAAHHVQPTPKSEPTSPTLDQLIGELARPMIKQWLDQHLPRLVELTVAKEIERLTKQLRND